MHKLLIMASVACRGKRLLFPALACRLIPRFRVSPGKETVMRKHRYAAQVAAGSSLTVAGRGRVTTHDAREVCRHSTHIIARISSAIIFLKWLLSPPGPSSAFTCTTPLQLRLPYAVSRTPETLADKETSASNPRCLMRFATRPMRTVKQLGK